MANNAMGLKWQSSYFQLQDQLKLLRLNKAKEKDHQNLMGGTYEKKRKRKEKKLMAYYFINVEHQDN